MAGKRVDPLKAKAAKQKKIAIVLCVLFVAVLAFQGPRTLKMLKGPQPVETAAPATTTPAPVAPVPTSGAPVTPAPAAAAGAPLASSPVAQPAVLSDSDIPVEAGDGQLLSFERFQTKDPFAQQAEAVVAPVAAPTPGPVKATPVPSTGSATPGSATPGSAASGGLAAGPGSAAGGTTPVPSAPVNPPATATNISINGLPEDVLVGASFPAADPVFMLVSLAPDGTSVQIGIAGGVYADGKETIKLVLGKPLTLQNTADGTRFELKLHTVLGFAPPNSKPQK